MVFTKTHFLNREGIAAVAISSSRVDFIKPMSGVFARFETFAANDWSFMVAAVVASIY